MQKRFEFEERERQIVVWHTFVNWFFAQLPSTKLSDSSDKEFLEKCRKERKINIWKVRKIRKGCKSSNNKNKDYPKMNNFKWNFLSIIVPQKNLLGSWYKHWKILFYKHIMKWIVWLLSRKIWESEKLFWWPFCGEQLETFTFLSAEQFWRMWKNEQTKTDSIKFLVSTMKQIIRSLGSNVQYSSDNQI